MMKKYLAIFLCLILLLTSINLAFAADIPASIKAPQELSGYYNGSSAILRWTEPQSISDMINPGPGKILGNVLYQIDYKINDGPWSTDGQTWTDSKSGPQTGGLIRYAGSAHHDINNVMECFVNYGAIGLKSYDLANNTYHFRVRYLVSYYAHPVYKYVVSEFSNTVSIGKNAESTLPATLDAPINVKAELKTRKDGAPYFLISWDIPQSIIEANKKVKVGHVIDWKVNDGKWASEERVPKVYYAGSGLLDNKDEINPLDKGGIGEVKIDANTYYFRVLYKYDAGKIEAKSPYSNIASIGTPAFYRGASSWAVPDLNKAQEYGFITDKIKDNMSGPITREEFSELAVQFYQKITGKTATYTDMSAFDDTQNAEVFKAYELGIVTGIGGSKFAPQNLIIREQMAAMIQRAVKAVKPETDFGTENVKPYPDESKISKWALPFVKFMNKSGLMTHINGNFEPGGTTFREQAVVIIVRAYEKYK